MSIILHTITSFIISLLAQESEKPDKKVKLS